MHRGNCHDCRAAQLLPETLVITKKKHSVLDNRTPNGSAKLIIETTGNELACYRVARGLLIWIAREIRIALTVVKGAAVEGVGPGFRLRRDNGRNRFAEFRVEILRCNLCFRNCIQCWIDDDDSEDRILVVSAIQLIGNATERLSVNLDLLAALRILISGVRPGQLLCARQQQLETGEISVCERQV